MNAEQTDQHIASGVPVVLNSHQHGAILCQVLARKSQQVTLCTTGQYRSPSARMMNLTEVYHVHPAELAGRLLPPGVVIQAKTYGIMPAGGDWGMNPLAVMKLLQSNYGTVAGHTFKTAANCYGAAADILTGLVGIPSDKTQLLLATKKTAKKTWKLLSKGDSWLRRHGMTAAGFKLYAAPAPQARKLMTSPEYLQQLRDAVGR